MVNVYVDWGGECMKAALKSDQIGFMGENISFMSSLFIIMFDIVLD